MPVTPELDYQFVCHYDDGEKLYQNSGKDDEHHFGHIDQDRLERFELVGKNKSYSVNVRTGEFDLNGTKIYFDSLPKEAEYRLIYFRRVNKLLGEGGEEYGTHLRYCFGLQCNYEGKNKQVLVWINEDDSLSIGNKK